MWHHLISGKSDAFILSLEAFLFYLEDAGNKFLIYTGAALQDCMA